MCYPGMLKKGNPAPFPGKCKSPLRPGIRSADTGPASSLYLEVSDVRHIWRKHVEISDEGLRARLRRENITAATRFTCSPAWLKRVLRDTICGEQNLDKLRKYLHKSRGLVDAEPVVLISSAYTCRGKDGVKKPAVFGTGFSRKDRTTLREYHHVAVVIVPIPGFGLKGGLPRFRIINAFPCEEDYMESSR